MKVRLQQEKLLVFLPAENARELCDQLEKVCARCHVTWQVVPIAV